METHTLPGLSARVVRVAETPTLSVVVTSTGDRPQLETGLRQLLSACGTMDVQVVVVRVGEGRELEALRAAYPSVRFTMAPAGTTVPELRVIGMGQAEGDIVILGEDDRISHEWLSPRLWPST